LIKTFVSRTPPPEPFEFSDIEVEVLAHQEHRRWMSERAADGWSEGPERDNELKLHPDMVAWADLGEVAREKDRNAVRKIPGQLGMVGLHIVRRPPVDR
jgi:hypothetical protein